MRRSVGLALSALLTFGPAQAQTDIASQVLQKMSGTMSVTATPEMSDGKLSGCSLVFEALQQDYKYLGGNYIKVSGSVGFMEANGSLGIFVKVVAAEMDPSLPELFSKFLDVSRGYLIAPDLKTNFSSLVTSTTTDNQGRFSIFPIDSSLGMIVSGVQANRITVAYAIGDGASDIQTPIEIDVADIDAEGNRKRSDDARNNFLTCTATLLEPLAGE